MTEEKINLEQLIVTLLDTNDLITVQAIAEAAGFSSAVSAADRRAIQRTLKELVEAKKISAHGQARARSYGRFIQTDNKYNDISISTESQRLLKYLSQPIHLKKSVGYNPDFIKSYKPNHTYYLNPSIQEKLHAIGRAELNVKAAGTYARTILNRLLIDLSWNSSRLEGNTYSLLETQRLIDLGETASGKNVIEAQMILNHKNAIEYIIELANEKKITSYEIRGIHALLSDNLLGDSSACGRIRNIIVGVSGASYSPSGNPHLLQEYFDIIIEKLNLIEDPFEQSFFALAHFSYLQAFEDVNKRTGRLVANIPLIKHNLKPLSFVDVKQSDYVTALLGVYEKNDVSLLRDWYVWAYQHSAHRYSAVQEKLGEPNLFVLKYRDTIHHIIRMIILNNVSGSQITAKIKELIAELALTESESTQLFQLIETEIMNLHDGNIARYKILPSEFQRWQKTGA